ncbi:MAG: hypothetical protein ACOYM3_26430, partial [Terrimicrobiaceae bacterium]
TWHWLPANDPNKSKRWYKLFAGSFRNGTEGLRQKISGGIVAIDGQTLRRSYDKRKSTSAIHRVSAWGREVKQGFCL